MTKVIDYTPPGTLAPLFTDSKLWNVIIGPIGSCKTAACIFYMLMRAATQRPGPNGIRRTRYVISRQTLPQLRMTVLQDILMYIGDIARWEPSKGRVMIETGDISSEWYLIPLDTPQDQRRLLSMQLSGFYANEAREIPFELIYAAAGRIPRFPPKTEEGVSHPFILMDSNPAAVGSDLYNFCMKPDPNKLVIHQPSALSEEADWLHYLEDGYYENMMIGASPDWIDVHIHAKWAKDMSGMAIYASSFDDERHVSRTPIEPVFNAPVLVGLDPGRQPAAIICQVNEAGALLALREAHAENLNFRSFFYEVVRPMLREFIGAPILAVLDPAGRAKSGLSEESPYTVVRDSGMKVVFAPTNDIEPRITAVDRLLLTWDTRGRPMFRIDATHCPTLLRALRGEYRYRRTRTGSLENKPEKRHPISDVMDCLQYVAMVASGRSMTWLRHRFDEWTPRTAAAPTSTARINLQGWA